jgi:serine/threonine protein kinase
MRSYPSSCPTAQPRRAYSWGRFRLLGRLGEGAFGTVYRAFDPRSRGEVALKVLNPRDAHDDTRVRLRRECRNLARVHHRNVVALGGADLSDRRSGFWMELVRGETLADLLRSRGRFTVEDAAAIGRDLCRAVTAVHAAALVHGDIKAQNVMREASGRVVLVDFGSSLGRDEALAAGDRLTGTPQYLAPEILDGGEPGTASDIYSLGVLLFHLATGTYPVTGRSIDALKHAHAVGDRCRVTDFRDDLPRAFVAAIEGATCAAKVRFATAHELLDILKDIPPPLPHRFHTHFLSGSTASATSVAPTRTATFSGSERTTASGVD